ncbi:MAG TPA: CopD family protein [Sporichthya sp.]|nr:CopD family protein [Sporichthya sp.]
MSRRPLPATFALAILCGCLLSLWGPVRAHAAEGPGVRTVPAANEVVGPGPLVVRVLPAGRPDGSPGSGRALVLDHTGVGVAAVHLQPSPTGGLAGTLPVLAPGVHLVSWTAGDLTGSFAFDVVEDAGSPVQVRSGVPPATLKSTADVAVEWTPLIAMCLLVGALSLRFVATAPAATRATGRSLPAVDLRLTRLAAGAAVVFLPTAWFATGWDDGTEDWSAAWDRFGADAPGGVLLARFLLATAAALVLVPLALRRRPPSAPALGVALACGLGELALRHVPTRKPPVMTRAVWDSVMWVGHLWGSALWIGGLVALLVVVLASPVPAGCRAEFWPTAIRRFSLTALGSVAALVLSGLWLYWVHVDSLAQLFTTLYGRTLLVKFAILAFLLAVGAVNLLWVMPRAEVHEAAADHRGMTALVHRHFRATVAVEVVLGLSLLFVANFLSGSSRNQALQASDDLFRTTALAGETTVGLSPSGLQPGLVEYVVDVTGPAPKEVELTFNGPFDDADPAVPPQHVTATAIGDGRYRATGMYAPVVGAWRVDVQADGGPIASFPLTIADQAPPPPRAPAKTVSLSTWIFGVLETLLVAAILAGAVRGSRRLSRGRPAAGPPADPGVRELIDA